MSEIIDLKEISPNNWLAKYEGNYGIYTIKIVTDGKKMSRFSCSCPSDASPCKHISIIAQAIVGRIAQSQDLAEEPGIGIGELLAEASRQELSDFIMRQAKYNPELSRAILLEFAQKKTDDQNRYTLIIRRELAAENADYEDYEYSGEYLSLHSLDQWLDKAGEFLQQKNYGEAVLISKACIEEYAAWLETVDEERIGYIASFYQSEPFALLQKAFQQSGISAQELFDYCMAEMKKKKYSKADMFNRFNELLMLAAPGIDPEGFIALQDSLLNEIEDKSSWSAEKILRRKLDFYQSCGHAKKALKLVEDNLQIKSFRKQMVEKYIEQKKYTEAKKLIHDYKIGLEHDAYRSPSDTWDGLLLDIAQQEKDLPNIKKIARMFLDNHFQEKYFHIYKSAFSAGEWTKALEDLINSYQEKEKGQFSQFAAEALAAEKAAERLMLYVEKYLALDRLETYYAVFAHSFPEKTLALFRDLIDKYALNNTGRTYYEHIIALFYKMRGIKNGQATVTAMINQYKVRYKNRKAMIEILDKFCNDPLPQSPCPRDLW
jgi:hypothetical protein